MICQAEIGLEHSVAVMKMDLVYNYEQVLYSLKVFSHKVLNLVASMALKISFQDLLKFLSSLDFVPYCFLCALLMHFH